MIRVPTVLAAAALCASCAMPMTKSSNPATVKVTPLGSLDGEFCPQDRAMIFEDPNGTRILYDAGFTVRGGDDPRLGKIDMILLSHMHGDHLGNSHQPGGQRGHLRQPGRSGVATCRTPTR